MDTRDNLLIVNMPRCGSNLLQAALHFNYQAHGIERLYLDEFFLSHNEYYVDHNGVPICFYFDRPLRQYFQSYESYWDFYMNDVLRKLRLYDEYKKQPLTAKLVYNGGFDVVMEKLIESNEKFVVLYRRDLAAQLMSYIAAKYTDLWNMDDSTKLRYVDQYNSMPSISISARDIFQFANDTLSFENIVKHANIVGRYAYEDLCTNLAEIVQNLSGLEYKHSYVDQHLPRKTSEIYDQRQKICNYDSVYKIFSHHSIGELADSPIEVIDQWLHHE